MRFTSVLFEKQRLYYRYNIHKGALFMDNLKIEVNVLSAHPDELSDEDRNLGSIALSASERAYSPYSGFSVGAVAMLDDGTIIEGSNIENCAYPSGLCAERVAMFHALSRWPDKKVLKLCIAARGTDGKVVSMPVTLCGACRQVLLESERRQGTPIEIIMWGSECTYICSSALDLMPLAFVLNND